MCDSGNPSQEWEACMVEFSIVLGLRQVIEQPVGSRFFRHPDMAEAWFKGMTAVWM